LTNATIKSTTDALAELLQPSNRLPVTDLMRATRAYAAYTAAWAPAEEVRLRMISERGTEQADGTVSVEKGDVEGFLQDLNVLLAEEAEAVEADSFSLDGGYTKAEDGDRIALDLSAGAVMALLEADLIK